VKLSLRWTATWHFGIGRIPWHRSWFPQLLFDLQVFVEDDEFLDNLARCLKEAAALGTVGVHDAHVEDLRHTANIWKAANWLDLVDPVAYLLKSAVGKFQKAAFRPSIQGLLQAADEALCLWENCAQLPDSTLRMQL
jgi:hypothetical protein